MKSGISEPKSADGRRACIAACSRGAQAIWVAGCFELKDDQQVVHVGGTGVAETLLVSDGYDVENTSMLLPNDSCVIRKNAQTERAEIDKGSAHRRPHEAMLSGPVRRCEAPPSPR